MAKIARRRSGIHGYGVFATAPIRKGEKVAEYKGRVIPREVANRLYDDGMNTGHTFLFGLNEKWDVDANVGGNIAKWINHGCAPNCITFRQEQRSRDPKKDRIIIEARRAIEPGEEILYDYHITSNVRYTKALFQIWACHCGSPRCKGTMLKPTKRQAHSRK